MAFSFVDETIKCRDCGREFVFTVAEQREFASLGREWPPSRCADCRAARKARQAAQGIDVSAPRSSKQGRELFPAICAECGAQTQVPFQPRTDKPVYCSACFSRVRAYR